MPHRLAIFASGTGTNAEKIMEYFADRPDVSVALVVSNKANAGVLARARRFGVPTMVIDRATFYESEDILKTLFTKQPIDEGGYEKVIRGLYG